MESADRYPFAVLASIRELVPGEDNQSFAVVITLRGKTDHEAQSPVKQKSQSSWLCLTYLLQKAEAVFQFQFLLVLFYLALAAKNTYNTFVFPEGLVQGLSKFPEVFH